MIVEASRAYSRGLIRGVARFQCEHQKWLLDYTTRGLDDPLPGWLSRWHGDGILARLNSRRMAKAVARRGVPVIDLRRAFADLGLPSIGPDGSEIARIAYEHLRERGFTNFGFFGPPEGVHHELDQRAISFLRYVREAGFVCDMFKSRRSRGGADDSAPGPGTSKQILPFDGLMLELRRASATQWDRKLQSVVCWIRQLSKPVGVMVGNDDYGMLLINACRSAKVRIPEEIAIVGVGNDECLCSLSVPPLTSIDLFPQRIGYEASEMLDAMMDGKSVPEHQLVVPSHIEVRGSTDVLVTSDAKVRAAVQFIRENACQGIQVRDVLRHVKLSRTALAPRIKTVLGRTTYQEIQRVQVQRIKELLVATDASTKQIARMAGFHYPEYMMRVFRKATGKTPTEYRKSMRSQRH